MGGLIRSTPDRREGKSVRKAYLDNLRWVLVFELVFMHTCMCYNSCGLPFYFRAPGLKSLDLVMTFQEPWRQSVLFLAAGASMRYAVAKRGWGGFVKNRLLRIALPLAFAKLTLIPMQVYAPYYTGGPVLSGYWTFFKTIYLPGFLDYYWATDAQLWFLAVLLGVTAASMVFLAVFNRRDRLWQLGGRADLRALFLLTLPVALMGFVLRTDLYHFYGRYFPLYLLGYLLFSHEEVCEQTARHWAGLTALALTVLGYLLWKLGGTNYYAIRSGLDEGLWYAAGWLGSLAFLGIFARFFRGSNRVTRYLARASMPVYILHQTILVWLALWLSRFHLARGWNYLLVWLLTTVLSLGVYELLRRVPGVRLLIGVSGGSGRRTAA